MKALPLARQSSLVVKDVDDATLVYDRETDEAHCLNKTAARVWKQCDGKTTPGEIAQRLGDEFDTQVDQDVVWLALDQLNKFKLLEQSAQMPPAFLSSVSRRQVVRALGVAAIVLPAVTSIIVPHATAQASCIPPGGGFCCVSPNDCCCPPNNPTCCNPTPQNAPCTDYPPNPQQAGKQCNF